LLAASSAVFRTNSEFEIAAPHSDCGKKATSQAGVSYVTGDVCAHFRPVTMRRDCAHSQISAPGL